MRRDIGVEAALKMIETCDRVFREWGLMAKCVFGRAKPN